MEIFRGDTKTVRFKVTKKSDGELWTPEANCSIYFTCKPFGCDSDTAYIQKKYPDNIVFNATSKYFTLTLDPADTKDLKLGKYEYDIEIKLEDGTTKTVCYDELVIKKDITKVVNEV